MNRSVLYSALSLALACGSLARAQSADAPSAGARVVAYGEKDVVP